MAKRQSPKRSKHPGYAKPERAIGSANDRSDLAAVFAALCPTALSTVWLLSTIGMQTGGVPPTPQRDPPHVNRRSRGAIQ